MLKIAKCEKGTIAILAAIVLPVVTICAGLAVDFGRIYLERRAMQGAVDLAAMAAAGQLEYASELAKGTLDANGKLKGADVSVTLGNYKADESVAPAKRFRANVSPVNAVKVKLKRQSPLYFGRILGETHFGVSVSAVSATKAQATFSVGSRLLALRGGILNALLAKLLGGNIELSVMDYRALVNAQVKLVPFLQALATELDLTVGSFNDILEADATVGNILNALIAVQGSDNLTAKTALRLLSSYSNVTSLTVKLQQLISLGDLGQARIGDGRPGFDALVSVMDIVRAAAILSNGSSQISVDLGVNLPGIASVTLKLNIGEPEQYSTWLSGGPETSMVKTAQTRLTIIADVLGKDGVVDANVRLPIHLRLATAQAQLAGVQCGPSGSPVDARATIAARSGVAEAWLGDENSKPTDFATLVDLAILRVKARAHVLAGSMYDSHVTFTQEDVDNNTVKRTSANDVLKTLVSKLISETEIQVGVGNAMLTLPGLGSSKIKTLLESVAAPLDTLVFDLLRALGLHFGEADIRVHGIRCGSAVLSG